MNREKSAILVDLVTERTKKFFERFKLRTDFFTKPSIEWENCEDYKHGRDYVKKLKVVNDSAERGIKLLEDYHNHITKDEMQKQYVLKVTIVCRLIIFISIFNLL